MYSAPIHLGDWKNGTEHLTMLQRGAYISLLFWMYANERDLPDVDACLRIAGAHSSDERKAVIEVIEEFFEVVDGGFTHYRTVEEILRARERSKKSRESANVRWQKERGQVQSGESSDANAYANALRTHMPNGCESPCESDASFSFSSSSSFTSASSSFLEREKRQCPEWIGGAMVADDFTERVAGAFGRWAFDLRQKGGKPVFEAESIDRTKLLNHARWMTANMPDTADAWGDLRAKLDKLSETARGQVECRWVDPAVQVRTMLRELREGFGRSVQKKPKRVDESALYEKESRP